MIFKYIHWASPDSVGRLALSLPLVCLLVGIPWAQDLKQTYVSPPSQQVISFLTQTIDWYRVSSNERAVATEPSDLLFLEDNESLDLQIVQLSFDYARADAALENSSNTSNIPSAPATAPRVFASDLQHFLAIKAHNEAECQNGRAELLALKQLLTHAKRKNRKQLEAALADVQSRVDLLQAESGTLESLIQFLHTSTGEPANGDLNSVTDELARTVPQLSNGATPSAPQNTRVSAFRKPTTSGIAAIMSDISNIRRKLRTLEQIRTSTTSLAASSQKLRQPLAHFLAGALHNEDVTQKTLEATNLELLRKQKIQLDAVTIQVKALAPALVALGKQRALLELYQSHLTNWRQAVLTQYNAAWKKLVLHLAIVATIIVLWIAAARTSQRVLFNYVHDENRRHVILLSKRMLLWFGIFLIGILSFVSNLSSLATFLGLLTAGLAVAFQNVLLAILGYFVLVAGLGVRIGDRVQVSGVAGELIELGLLQFRIREIDGQEQGTGRIASFSNSFVFVSPATAMFKIPRSLSVAHR